MFAVTFIQTGRVVTVFATYTAAAKYAALLNAALEQRAVTVRPGYSLAAGMLLHEAA